MAYRRSITTRANLLARRFNPSFSYVLHEDDRKHQSLGEVPSQLEINNVLQLRFFGSSINTSAGFGAFHQERCFPVSIASGMGLNVCRHMSTAIGEGSNKIEYMSDVAGVLSDTTLETVVSQVPAVNEVAIAAADSYIPVAALQYVIDGVHSFTGLNWWASIALTTLLIRGATIPFLINQLKATSKLTIMRPQLEAIKQEMQDKGMDPDAMAEGQKRMSELFKKYGVTPWTPLKGLLIQGPVFVSFFLAISNMAEKVPSFKNGGAYWFTDLSTPDTLYIFPIMTALTFLITVECNMQEGMEGNPVAGTMKKFSRGLAVLTVPLTMNFPKAVFCYWVTSNVFSLMYGLVIKRPAVKKFCGIPKIPVAPPTSGPQSDFSLAAIYKQYKEGLQKHTSSPVEPPSPDQPKLTDRKISSSSVINQRIRSLEKQVKGRKKNKKR